MSTDKHQNVGVTCGYEMPIYFPVERSAKMGVKVAISGVIPHRNPGVVVDVLKADLDVPNHTAPMIHDLTVHVFNITRSDSEIKHFVFRG